MLPDLTVRAVGARELMDDPDADQRMLERTYARFSVVNRIVSPWHGEYRREIRPRARRGVLRVLDVGAGAADLTRALAVRLRRDGIAASVTALDADPRAVDWARAHDDGVGLRCVRAMTGDLVGEGERFDVVLSNHLLHHLTDDELQALLGDSERLLAPGGIALHHDIARGRAAYALFAAATRPFAANLLEGSFIREDGLTSIRRSRTAGELAALAPAGWSVRRGMPARLTLRREAPDAAA
ncbi:methyltransferase domain-containing protein [Microbacterium sp. NPDC058342]|uniref:methyltransferase domain-containing protein n=1 Tax=Microbacterium sp. NPDC058342 TaxID=3346454 RepID=UPI0036518E47